MKTALLTLIIAALAACTTISPRCATGGEDSTQLRHSAACAE